MCVAESKTTPASVATELQITATTHARSIYSTSTVTADTSATLATFTAPAVAPTVSAVSTVTSTPTNTITGTPSVLPVLLFMTICNSANSVK